MTTFERIKKLAKSRDVTLQKVANDLGFGESTLYKWKNQTPNGEYLSKVADYFHVSVDYLLGREKENNTDKDINEALDEAMSYDGKPLTDHDRDVIKQLLNVYLENKDK